MSETTYKYRYRVWEQSDEKVSVWHWQAQVMQERKHPGSPFVHGDWEDIAYDPHEYRAEWKQEEAVKNALLDISMHKTNIARAATRDQTPWVDA